MTKTSPVTLGYSLEPELGISLPMTSNNRMHRRARNGHCQRHHGCMPVSVSRFTGGDITRLLCSCQFAVNITLEATQECPWHLLGPCHDQTYQRKPITAQCLPTTEAV